MIPMKPPPAPAPHLASPPSSPLVSLPPLAAAVVAIAACAILHATGCAHQPGTRGDSPSVAVPRITSDDEYARARADYDLLAPNSPARAAQREGLERYVVGEVEREIKSDRLDAAWESFGKALSLWDPEELRSPGPDPRLCSGAEELERNFRRRGAHHEVLTLLGVQIALRPDDPAAHQRFDQVVGWMRGDGVKDTCNDKSCEQVIEDLETAFAAFPAPFLLSQLEALYWQRQAGAGRFAREPAEGGALAQLLATRAAARTGIDLARMYLRVSRPDAALAALQKLSGQPGDDPALRDAIARYLAPEAKPLDAVTVAAAFARDPGSRVVSERICIDAAKRFPNAVEPQLCVGELALQLEQITIAIRAFEQAQRIAPDKRESWEALARLHQLRLQQLVGDERADQLEAELRKVEELHTDAQKRFPSDPLKTPLSAAYDVVGRGLYNAGRIDDALRYVDRSLAAQPSPSAYEQRATIELKRERGPEAAEVYKKAIDFVKSRRGEPATPAATVYWLAKLERGLGDAYEQMGNTAGADDAHKKSLEAWDALLAQARGEADDVAEAEVERGKLFYLFGERDKALAAFDRAMDAAPERGATYADLLSFLAPRSERNLALEVFHRALGRGGISEYLKVYCSLWVIALDRRAGEPDDPVAHDFLAGEKGGKWYHELARWASGRESDAELAAHADTPAKRCEADFYVGLRRLDEGKADEARALFKKVVGSQMMAFFEFDMASYYLRHPTPAVPGARPKPASQGHAGNDSI